MLDDYQRRKALRKQENDAYMARIAGTVKIRIKCIACNGSGRYDHNGSPRCGACNGTGHETRRVKPEEVESYRAFMK